MKKENEVKLNFVGFLYLKIVNVFFQTLSKQLDENCHKDVQMDSFVQLNNELKGQLSFVQQQYEKIAKEFETLKIEKNDIDNRYQSMMAKFDQTNQELTKQKLEHSNYVDEINKKFIGMFFWGFDFEKY